MRTVIFWVHFVIGLATGLFILVMSLTGGLLTYQAQIERWARNAAIEAPEGATPLSVDAAAAAARAAGAGPGAVLALSAEPTEAIEVSLGRRQMLYLDPFTGAPLPAEAGAWAADFFDRIVAIHRWLAFSGERSETGAAIMAAANAFFAGILVTGVVLWWPRRWRWRVVRNQLVFRRGLPNAQARDYNWHHALGAWCLVPLIAIVFSGVLIAYPALSSRVYGLIAAPANAPAAGSGASVAGEAAPLGELVEQATEGAAPWRRMLITLPKAEGAPVKVALDRGNGVQLSRIETFEVSPGRVESLSAAPASPQRFVRFLHTGEIYGLLGQTVAGLASFGAAVLAYTGIALGLRRLGRMARRRATAG